MSTTSDILILTFFWQIHSMIRRCYLYVYLRLAGSHLELDRLCSRPYGQEGFELL